MIVSNWSTPTPDKFSEITDAFGRLQNALALLGLGTDAEGKVLASAQADRAGVRDAQAQIWSKIIEGWA